MPASEKPLERFLAEGAHKLSDAELIALVLHTGVSGRSRVDLARSLLTEYGGLANLLCADIKRLLSSTGIGAAKAAPLGVILSCPTGISPNRLRALMYSRTRPPRGIISARASETAPA